MANKLHSDVAVPPFMESIKCTDLSAIIPDLEAATKTITATAEASGLGNADYSNAQKFNTPTDARITLLNIIAGLNITIDSDDGTHDLRCRVYIDAQDADHMIFDVSCTTTGAQISVQNFNASTLATLFTLIKDNATHTYYFYFWSPGNHSSVISVVSMSIYCGSNSTGTTGIPVISFTSPVPCEIQVRQQNNASTGTLTCYAFINGVGYYDAGHAMTETGALIISGTAGSSASGGWTWQILPANQKFDIHSKLSTAAGYHYIPDVVYYIKRWN